jgi:iron-sulfur cluster repair protein YtfE (RIC family)
MGESEQWIFPGMPVLALLHARPAALGVLEGWGIDPWVDPHARLDALAAAKHLPWPAFEAELDALPEVEGDRDWESASIPDLLDHLISDHRDILDRLVPALRIALDRAPSPANDAHAGPDGSWKAFAAGLNAHMREEENFLFPRLLHYAYCLRHHGSHPDFDGGSVNVYIAIRLLGNEHKQKEDFQRFLTDQDARFRAMAKGSPEQERIGRLLEEFRERMERHNHLEEKVLYPKARDLEKSLYDSAIAGSAQRSQGAGKAMAS